MSVLVAGGGMQIPGHERMGTQEHLFAEANAAWISHDCIIVLVIRACLLRTRPEMMPQKNS
jgi:hypothetical protein